MRLHFDENSGDQWHLMDELAPHYRAIKKLDGTIELWTDDAEQQIAILSAEDDWTANQLRKLAAVYQDAFAEGENFGEDQARRSIRGALGIPT